MLPRTVIWSMTTLLAGLSLAGCRTPADLARPPDPGPPPELVRDDSRSTDQPIGSSILDTANAHPNKHHAVLLETGDDALLARIHLIRSARESIDIQTFIWV